MTVAHLYAFLASKEKKTLYAMYDFKAYRIVHHNNCLNNPDFRF